MPSKHTKTNSKVSRRDLCQTPPYALLSLLKHIPKDWVLHEPAAGEGLLAEALIRMTKQPVIETCISTGLDFYFLDSLAADMIVTNPPFSHKYKWLRHCFELGKPFALLLPVESLGAASAQALMNKYGAGVILMNRRVNFKMPDAGWSGLGADYPVMWFTYGLPTVEPNHMVYSNDIPLMREMPKWMVRPDSRKEIADNAR
jgi:hypothetical protein